MLRITVGELNERGAVIRLEGRVIGRWVAEVQKACDRQISQGRRVTLDMEGVRFVDANGVVLLCSLIEQGVELMNCSKFVSKQVERATRST